MTHSNRCAVALMLGILFTGGNCGVSESPQNLAVYAGQRTSFACRPSTGSFVREWLFRPLSDSTNMKIFSRWGPEKPSKKIDSKYGAVATERGFTELFINETELEDAGEYTCVTEVDAKIVSFRADLVVLESEPECSVTEFVDHRIRVGCSVAHSGKWPPKMEWRHHITGTAFADGILFYNGINTDNYANKTLVISTLNAFVLHSVQDAFTVSCKTFFDAWQTIVSKFSASNVPDFVYIWNSTVFGPKKSTNEPTNEADENFENITCPVHADVNTQASLVDEEIQTNDGNVAFLNESIALEIEEQMKTMSSLSSNRRQNSRRSGTQAQFSGCTHWL